MDIVDRKAVFRLPDARPAVLAGIAAGVVSTVAQVALWLVFTDAFPDILFRDARFAAATVLGRGVLPPPASFDLVVTLAATVVHFALSIAYGLVLATGIGSLGLGASVVAGAAFGIALFIVNMYGFTAVFPWFAAARDAITLAAHVVFGVSAAAVYHALSARRRLRIKEKPG
ncbi:sodium:proline symporter [Aromatoleum sp.]|uniref:sodium:proline symporter n=1 Tax=Aromatoleum sp. TaxID=2307007 RepID=UPI002FCB2214